MHSIFFFFVGLITGVYFQDAMQALVLYLRYGLTPTVGN